MFKYFNLKYLIILLSFCINIALFAQENLVPKATIAGIAQSNLLSPEITKQLSSYSAYKLNTAAIFESITSENFEGRIALNLGEHGWILNLVKNEVLADSYKGFELSTEGKEQLTALPIHTYSGFVEGKPDNRVSLTLGENFLYGFVENDQDVYYIEPLSRFTVASNQDFIVYPQSAVVSKILSCGVNDTNEQTTFILKTIEVPSAAKTTATCKTIEIAIAHDYSMYTKYGSDIQSLFAYTIGVLNNVQTNYRNVFDVDVEFKIVEQIVPTCQACDPWTTSPDAGSLLLDFRNWGNASNFNSTFDIGQFWTDRDFTGPAVGKAYVGGLCQTNKYHVLQDYTTNADYIRVVAAHEIGHNLNAGHNNSVSGNIMDPNVSNVSSWSPNSVAAINTFLLGNPCIADCSVEACPTIENLTLSNITSTSIDVTWTANPAGNYKILIKNSKTNKVVYAQIVNDNQLSITPPLSLCTDFVVTVNSICSGDLGKSSTAIFSTSYDTKMELISTDPINCKNGYFDLELVIEHGSGSVAGFIIDLNGVLYPQTCLVSPQTVLIEGLRATETAQITVLVYDAAFQSDACEAISFFDAPDPSCTYVFEENFDKCSLPSGWETNNLVVSSGGYASTWEFSDEERYTSNYPAGTIDGTCMAYFDDDLYSSTGGVMELLTPTLDLTNYESLTLEFDYDFHSFDGLKLPPHDSNNSSFNVELYNGNAWINVLSVTKPDTCYYSDFWSCPPPQFKLSLDSYQNVDFQVRFVYDDDGKWAGAAAIDNFKITGSPLCELPNTIQTVTSTLQADTECTDAEGWTHYWNTDNPATLLLSIKKNDDPNLAVDAADIKIGTDFSNLTTLIPETTPYVMEPSGWPVMSRYWDVQIEEEEQPSNPVSVRFYYTQAELSSFLNGNSNTSLESDIRWFKFKSGSGIDPNPANGHANATIDDFIALSPSRFGDFEGHRFVEFDVAGFSGGGGGAASELLPIELIDFKGQLTNKAIQLDWQTANERNSKEFQIERSLDGIRYEQIGRVAATGQSTELRNYLFVDWAPALGTNYYRLRSIDLDNEIQLSKVIAIKIQQAADWLQLAPNPTNEFSTLQISSVGAENLTLLLTDISGKLIRTTKISVNSGTSFHKLDLAGLPQGIYTLSVKGSQEIRSLRVLKI